MEEICGEAGVGRTTYYLYFESKEQLLVELTHATARGVADDVEHAMGADTLDDQLRALVDGLVRRMEGTPKSLAALTMQRAVAGATQPRPPRGDVVLFDHIFCDILRDAQRRGEVRDDVDPVEIGDVLGGVTMDALHGGPATRASWISAAACSCGSSSCWTGCAPGLRRSRPRATASCSPP